MSDFSLPHPELVCLAIANAAAWLLRQPVLRRYPARFQKQRRDITFLAIYGTLVAVCAGLGLEVFAEERQSQPLATLVLQTIDYVVFGIFSIVGFVNFILLTFVSRGYEQILLRYGDDDDTEVGG